MKKIMVLTLLSLSAGLNAMDSGSRAAPGSSECTGVTLSTFETNMSGVKKQISGDYPFGALMFDGTLYYSDQGFPLPRRKRWTACQIWTGMAAGVVLYWIAAYYSTN